MYMQLVQLLDQFILPGRSRLLVSAAGSMIGSLHVNTVPAPLCESCVRHATCLFTQQQSCKRPVSVPPSAHCNRRLWARTNGGTSDDALARTALQGPAVVDLQSAGAATFPKGAAGDHPPGPALVVVEDGNTAAPTAAEGLHVQKWKGRPEKLQVTAHPVINVYMCLHVQGCLYVSRSCL